MDSEELSSVKQSAIQAALAAGEVLAHRFGKTLPVREKEGAGLVTNADLEAEATAIEILRRDFPGFDFLAEESSQHNSTNPNQWIIDPLDGTTNFVHGFPMFCVSIGALVDGKLCTGVIYHPILKDLYVAQSGQGAFLNGNRITTSTTKDLTQALLTTGFNYAKKELLHDEMLAFERLGQIARAVRRPGSAALDMAYTACGVFDGFWERCLQPWDVAAGIVLVQEAGGKVSNFDGAPYQIGDASILASNHFLHASLLKTIRAETCPYPI